MTKARCIVTFALLAMLSTGCTTEVDRMGAGVKFVSFKGSTGVFVAPSEFVLEDNGSQWTLTSPDKQAVFNVFTFTVEGSGTPENLGNRMLDQLAPKDEKWTAPKWQETEINGRRGLRCDLTQGEDGEFAAKLVVLTSGELYHVLFLHASSAAMWANEGFYEETLETFQAISTAREAGNHQLGE
jgi:hypothetical protein